MMPLVSDPRHPQTMTVADLIAKLQEYPPDLRVGATWEGQLKAIMSDKFHVEPPRHGDRPWVDSPWPVLTINVDD